MIELENIKKRYLMGGSMVEALKGVSLKVEKGEFVSIMGPSGSGKSTLMNIIGCLDRPSEGAYTLNGSRVENMNEDELAAVRNKNIGFVFQTFNLLTRHTAMENVELPLLYAGVTNTAVLATKALEEVGLSARVNHRPNELSGGERQRVAIARAIVTEPAIILGDEPTGNLDSRTGAEIMDIFAELNKKGTTMVIVTHDREIADHSQRTITIRDGLIQDNG
ncbi:MAG TPA: ABC transporter ATP-binding protein [Thermodesulfobacteriota bacterium]|nr:ABC transporter ATP-binding protein [Thermodesulfobacteriota bacterium]